MPASICTLGSTPELSLAELEQFMSGPFLKLNDTQYRLPAINKPQELLHKLGGTVKFASKLALSDPAALVDTIVNILKQKNIDTLALSGLKNDHDRLQKTASDVKKGLSGIRYRILDSPTESAGILDKYQELQLILHESKVLVALVTAVQDIDRWSRKDYGRPAVDPKSGMLPPKIARIMVNIAVNDTSSPLTLYDPFCGSGTVLMEALERGATVVGSDISTDAVNDTIKNLTWYQDNFQPPGPFHVFQLDATQIKPTTVASSVDTVVFEGFLGPPHIKEHQIKNYHKGLYKLYKGVFKRLVHVLKDESKLVCALPYFTQAKHVKTFDHLVDECENYGYTTIRSPLLYGREHAGVKRRLYFLQKHAQ